jgi:hypothetical protein
VGSARTYELISECCWGGAAGRQPAVTSENPIIPMKKIRREVHISPSLGEAASIHADVKTRSTSDDKSTYSLCKAAVIQPWIRLFFVVPTVELMPTKKRIKLISRMGLCNLISPMFKLKILWWVVDKAEVSCYVFRNRNLVGSPREPSATPRRLRVPGLVFEPGREVVRRT